VLGDGIGRRYRDSVFGSWFGGLRRGKKKKKKKKKLKMQRTDTSLRG